MKKNLCIFSCLIFSFCKAQTPIIDKYGDQPSNAVNNTYYRDVNGFLNQYVGTWLYTNGNTSLKIVFQKREELFNGGIKPEYRDMLIGEYQYIQNGIEKVNTIPQINSINSSYFSDMIQHHLIEISQKNNSTFPKCNECLPNEKRLQLLLIDPNYRNISEYISNEFIIRSYIENGLTKLKIWFIPGSYYEVLDNNGNPTINFSGYSLPYGEYILTKVN